MTRKPDRRRNFRRASDRELSSSVATQLHDHLIDSENVMDEFEELKVFVHHDLIKKLDRVETKVNYVLGGITVVGVLMPIVIELIARTHPA